MSLPLKDFDNLHALAQSELLARVLRVLQAAKEALTAAEVAAEVLGISGRYIRILSPEIGEVVPIIVQLLDALVAEGKLRRVSVPHMLIGPRAHYALAAAIPA